MGDQGDQRSAPVWSKIEKAMQRSHHKASAIHMGFQAVMSQ